MSSSGMMDLIRRMEGQGDRMRQKILMSEMEARNWLYYVQSYLYAGEEGHNLILDPVQQGRAETVLLCAHYDRFSHSPGANDDASACAILLDVADKLQGAVIQRNVRVVFFDDEEPTQDWRYPIGSSSYIKEIGLAGLHAVVDLELNGMGDAIGIWPVQGLEDRPVLNTIASVVRECGMNCDYGRHIPGFYADYAPFRDAGFADAYCLTTFHWKERKRLMAFGEGGSLMKQLRYLAWTKLGLQTVPTIFQHYHSQADTSEFISEDALQMMSRAVHQIALRLAS